MFRLLLLISHIGLLAALLNSTDPTVTVSKNLTQAENGTDFLCWKHCNDKCNLLSHNLDVFPTCLPRTVKDLDMSYNNLTVIRDQDVAYLSELLALSLSHNQITEVHWAIHVLGNLQSLDLSYNQMSVVPKCITLKKLTWLSLAGNPISHIHAFAFSCFPRLEFLDLSFTFIGNNSNEDIEESAFAINTTEGKQDSLKSLDLSGTYLTRVKEAWGKDLPNLEILHLKNMVKMERLEDELLRWFPRLKILNPSGSRKLIYVRTEIFENASQLNYLLFQNCSLISFPSWKITSSQITIDLRGNPLNCTCELEWLFSENVNVSLTRPDETFCSHHNEKESDISILQLREHCLLIKLNELDNETQDFMTPNSTIISPYPTAGSPKESLVSTQRPNKEQKDLLPESITVFKTTSFDTNSTTSSPNLETAFVTQKTSTVIQGVVFSEDSTLAITGVSGSSYELKFASTPALMSTVVSSTRFLSSAISTKAGSGQSIFENDSSNEDQAEIAREYPEDFDDEETKITTITSTLEMKACDYDHCRHLQISCIELQQLEPCLCPGLSGENTLPDPPYLTEVSEITDTSAQIHWCSSNSVIDMYQLVYQSEGGQNETVHNIYATMRQYTLYNLMPFTTYKVCVVGWNKKGPSVSGNASLRTPCAEFNTKPSYILILSILSALGGLFLVTIAVLSVYLYKACKNNAVNQYDTHLVSYKNPAFEYHLTIPSYH